jgi:long-chain acyl-CoA synthetase
MIGEICVSGPQVMAGYWRNPQETAKALAGGRLHTGDLGYIDPQGHTVITGRLKNLVIVGGFNVYPFVVEEAISRHPAVARVAVRGMPDAYRGESVQAFIVRRSGHVLTAHELRAFLKDKLAPYETPKLIIFTDSISALGFSAREKPRTAVNERRARRRRSKSKEYA